MPIPEHFSWPPHFKVAKIIAACLPSAVVEEDGEGNEKRFIYWSDGVQILVIDETGWTYGFEARNGTWRSFLEGGYESIAKYVLGPVVEHGILVLRPPSHYDFDSPPEIKEVLHPRKR